MLGLEPFCSLNLSTYPNLIKEFLSLVVHYESGYKSTLRGIEVKLTPTTVSTFLNIFHHGNVAFVADPWKEALNVVLEKDDSET